MSALQGWPEVSFDEVFEISSSKRVLKSDWKTLGVPFYRAREIVKLSETGQVANDLFIDESLFENYQIKYGVPQAGDLMVSAVGTLGACYVVKSGDKFYFKDASVLQFRPKCEIDPRYFWHAFQTQALIDQINAGSGSTVGTLTISRAKALKLRLPPLDEQKRIAAILDQASELYRKRQRAIDRLNQLGQAIFHDMFEDEIGGQDRTPLGDLVEEFRYGTSNKSGDTGYPTLRIPNVVGGAIDSTELKTVPLDSAEFRRLKLVDGDVLFVRTNGNPDSVGRSAVFLLSQANSSGVESENWAYASYLIRARLDENRLNPWFLQAYLSHPEGKKSLRARAKTSAGQFNINTKGLGSIPIPNVDITRQLSFASDLEQLQKTKAPLLLALQHTDALFASLQHRAFQGEQ